MSLGDGQRKSFYGPTRKEAWEKLTAALRDRERGLPPASDERQTLGDYLTSWLVTIAPTIESTTLRRSRDYVRLHITPMLGRVRLTKLTPQQVQTLYAQRLDTGLSSTTVNHLHATLHKALSDAVRLGLVARNVCDFVTPPRVAETEMHPLTAEEARALVDVGSGFPLGPLYALAVATGMRQGELLGLQWSAVDLDAGQLSVVSNLQRNREAGGWEIRAPKTRRSRRQIALDVDTVATLRHHRAAQNAERLALGDAWHDRNLVFCTHGGNPLSARNVARDFKALLRLVSLPDIRFHDLRHTCATLALRAGINVKVVSEMLGHASVAITLDVYAHVQPDMQRESAATLGRILYG